MIGAVVLALALGLSAGWAQAQSPNKQAQGSVQPAPAMDIVAGSIPIQGRLTNPSGNPLSGLYDFTYSIYDSLSGGSLLCQGTSLDVSVVGGLFSDSISNCPSGIFDGQQLWLGIAVYPDPDMTPRQPIYPVPYAMSLKPGAVVSSIGGSAPSLTLKSNVSGAGGSALWADNTNTVVGGIAVWAIARGVDASVVIENKGTGPLLKGFGGDGGEDEFRLGNNGSIQSKADTYLFIPGSAFTPSSNAATTRWAVDVAGGVSLWRGSTGTSQAVYFPISLPAVLYGQPVKIESMTVYYLCQNGASNYITETWLIKQTAADSSQILINDSTDRTSTTATSYMLTPGGGNVLSSDSGVVVASLTLHFVDDVNSITIGGLRLRLHHHSLADG
jgi:hypothetical protein